MAQSEKQTDSVLVGSGSEANNSRVPNPQPPEESAAPEIKPISKVAGGVTAALTAAKYAFSEMGVGRGTRTLLPVAHQRLVAAKYGGADGTRTRDLRRDS